MNTLELLQQQAVSNFANGRSGFDPATLLVIIETVTTIIKTLQDCKKSSAEATKIVNDPTFLQKAVLRRWLVRDLGRAEYRAFGDDVLEAVLKTGREVNDETMAKALAEYVG